MTKRNTKILKKPECNKLLGEVRGLIISARRLASRSVDTIQVLTNFRIGQAIVEHEQQGQERAEYGKKILKKLSNHLTSEFGTGFSLTNLKLMRQFYFLNKTQIGQTVSGQLTAGEKGQTVSGLLVKSEKRHGMAVSPFKLSWSHYVFLMGIVDEAEQKFYEIEAAQQNWGVRELKRQYNSSLYERLALSRNKKKVLELWPVGDTSSIRLLTSSKSPLCLNFWVFMKGPNTRNPISNPPLSINWNIFCLSSEKAFFSKRDKRGLPLMAPIFMWISSSTIAS